jgi:hypothetical protein
MGKTKKGRRPWNWAIKNVIFIQKKIRSFWGANPYFLKAPLIAEQSLFSFPLFPYSTYNKGIRVRVNSYVIYLLRVLFENKGFYHQTFMSEFLKNKPQIYFNSL